LQVNRDPFDANPAVNDGLRFSAIALLARAAML
jgi:hypothetical protein